MEQAAYNCLRFCRGVASSELSPRQAVENPSFSRKSSVDVVCSLHSDPAERHRLGRSKSNEAVRVHTHDVIAR